MLYCQKSNALENGGSPYFVAGQLFAAEVLQRTCGTGACAWGAAAVQNKRHGTGGGRHHNGQDYPGSGIHSTKRAIL